MNLDILEKFTTHLRNTLSRSIELATELQQHSISPLIVLIALSEQQSSIGAELLKKSNISTQQLSIYLPNQTPGKSVQVDGVQAKKNITHSLSSASVVMNTEVILPPEFSDATKRVIERAAMLAFEFHHQYIGTEHLLLAVIQKPDDVIKQLFKKEKLSRDTLHKQLLNIMNSTSKFSDIQSLFVSPTSSGNPDSQHPSSTGAGDQHSFTDHDHGAGSDQEEDFSATPALEYFGTDLTKKEHLAKIDPVIGRNTEIERIIHMLSRRSKNNPVLIGDPGVGKTAIVEGLAKRIAEGTVPDILADKRIITLDLSSIIAGTMYRGEFESRLKQIIEEAKSHPDIILFIDEIHTIVGTGGVQGGTLDAANILKPALAKGEIRCIGATTADEYRKYIENDAALERRFQPIFVAEPTEQEAVDIIKGLRKRFEQFHHIVLPDESIIAAVQFAVRFIPDKRLPDKAIDLIDEAGAKTQVHKKLPAVLKKFNTFTRVLIELQRKKEHAVRNEKFDAAVAIKKKEDALIEKIKQLKDQLKSVTIPTTAVTVEHIAEIIHATTGVPVEQITASGTGKLLRIKEKIQRSIVGQEEAITQITSVIKRSYAGLSSPHKPLGSFIFLGPSGVGKTELAKVLAEQIFGDRSSLIRIDMSEFSESFTISKLIGAPAGYVGHNERIKFADQIRRRPYSVVLFDEIEKAHPDIFGILLQILDEGKLTDSTGRELNFRNSVIILTSNIGMDMLNKQAEIGFETENKKSTKTEFEQVSNTILNELPHYFPQEFLNRINSQIVFHPLSEKDMEQIITIQFEAIQKRAQERGITLHLSPQVRNSIAKKSFSPQQGARLIHRKLIELIENPLADNILAGSIISGDTVNIVLKKEEIILEKQKKSKK